MKKLIILLIILFCGGVNCFQILSYAYKTNGGFGFPLDDPWIHLQFAKNLKEYGAFSYYKNELITSGSTSPLYTFLLAIGFFLMKNEMLLSYILGVIFLLIAAVYIYKLAEVYFRDNIFYLNGVVILLLLEPRLVWVALSGMETTLFIALLLATIYYYHTQRAILTGMMLGLSVWVRPEAVLLFIAILLDWSYQYCTNNFTRFTEKQATANSFLSPWLKLSLVIFVIFCGLYIFFNYSLSGSVFPNTFAAKIKYYSGGVSNFPAQFFKFITGEHLKIFSIFLVVGLLKIIYNFFLRKPNPLFAPLFFSLAMFFAYWKNLPFLYQEGRYLMPILPFLILIGIGGVRSILEFLKKERLKFILSGIVMVIFTIQFFITCCEFRLKYAEYCRYISDRQVRTAKWLAENTPANSVIGTHDIGAIGFYSNRRIVDMVGLVSPEMIERIGKLDKLFQFLIEQNVTHLAVLRNWFEVVNVNPIFQTDPRFPEIMEVFEFDSNRVHLTPQQVTSMNETAMIYYYAKDIDRARSILEHSIQIDPYNSKTYYLLGKIFLNSNDLTRAEAFLKMSLNLNPEFWHAQFNLAELAIKRNDISNAIFKLEQIVKDNPNYAPSYLVLSQIYLMFHRDSVKASEYIQHYNRLISDKSQ